MVENCPPWKSEVVSFPKATEYREHPRWKTENGIKVFHLLPWNVFDIKYEMNEQPMGCCQTVKNHKSCLPSHAHAVCKQSENESWIGWERWHFGRAQLLSIAFSSLFTHNTEQTQSGRMREICSFAVWAVFKNGLKQKCFLLLNNKYKMPSHPLIQFSITAAIAAVAVATPYEINTMSKESHNSSDATNGSQMCECTCVFVYVCIYATHQGADVCDDGQMLFASRSH